MKTLAKYTNLLTAVAVLLMAFGLYQTAGAEKLAPLDLSAMEMNLNPAGTAYGISLDPSGSLWVSDYSAGEIWKIDPAGPAYTVYPVNGTPSNARADSSGKIWWADTEHTRIRRLTQIANTIETWEIPGSGLLTGLQTVSPQEIWVSDALLPKLYRLNLSSSQLCTFTLPDGGVSGDVVYRSGTVWAGDAVNGRIIAVDTSQNRATYWQLPAGSVPKGMNFDNRGNLWWSNDGSGFLDRLNPVDNELFRFSLPLGTLPDRIAWMAGYLWYDEQSITSLGRLDPANADHTNQSLTPVTVTIMPQCSPAQTGAPTQTTPTMGTAVFSAVTYSELVNEDAWAIYQLPENALPEGIVYRSGDAWVVDSGRRKLIRIPDVPVIGNRIIIQKRTDLKDSPQLFQFHTSYSTDFALTAGMQHESQSLTAGVYSVSEVNLPDDWRPAGAVCDDGSPPDAISLQDGETLTCVFTNISSSGAILLLPLVKK